MTDIYSWQKKKGQKKSKLRRKIIYSEKGGKVERPKGNGEFGEENGEVEEDVIHPPMLAKGGRDQFNEAKPR